MVVEVGVQAAAQVGPGAGRGGDGDEVAAHTGLVGVARRLGRVGCVLAREKGECVIMSKRERESG